MIRLLTACFMLTVGVATMSPASAENVDERQVMEYDYQTGSIVFKELFNPIGLTIRSASGKLLGGGGLNIGQIYDKNHAPNALSWSNFGGFGTGPHVAGLVVAPKTPPSDLTFEAVAGFNGAYRGRIVVINEGVPEPTTLPLVVLALSGCEMLRRRSISLLKAPVLQLGLQPDRTLAAASVVRQLDLVPNQGKDAGLPGRCFQVHQPDLKAYPFPPDRRLCFLTRFDSQSPSSRWRPTAFCWG